MPTSSGELGGETGWTPVELPFCRFIRSFVSSEPSSERINVTYFLRESDHHLVGKVWFGPAAEGPPRHTHGGALAALLDEAMGGIVWLAGHQAMATSLQVRFRKMLPLGTESRFEAWVVRTEGNRIFTEGRITDPAGVVHAFAEGIFQVPESKVLETLLAERAGGMP